MLLHARLLAVLECRPWSGQVWSASADVVGKFVDADEKYSLGLEYANHKLCELIQRVNHIEV